MKVRVEYSTKEEGFVFDVNSLYERLQRLKDLRQERDKRYPLATILSMIVLAKLAGEDKPRGIAGWLKQRAELLCRLLNFPRGTTPHYTTISRVLGEAVETIAITPRFAIDGVGYYSSNITYFIPGCDLYLLGLLNSRLGYFYFKTVCAGLEGKHETYLRFFGQYLAGFPVPITGDSVKDGSEKVSGLVKQMLELHQQLAEARIAHEKTLL